MTFWIGDIIKKLFIIVSLAVPTAVPTRILTVTLKVSGQL